MLLHLSIRLILVSLCTYAVLYADKEWFTFQVMFGVSVFNSCFYFSLRKVFSSYPAIYCKRILSGLSAASIVPGCIIALLDPEFLAEPLFGVSTALSISIGIELGSSLFDLLFLTPEQLKITPLIVHHMGTFLTFFFTTFTGFPAIAIAVALLMEGCNPFWYLHWILISSNKHMKHKTLWYINAFCAIGSYVLIRFCITHPVALWVTHWCFTVGEVNGRAPSTLDVVILVADQLIFFPMNVQNVLKLIRSLSYEERKTSAPATTNTTTAAVTDASTVVVPKEKAKQREEVISSTPSSPLSSRSALAKKEPAKKTKQRPVVLGSASLNSNKNM
eukprot:TRINITY_DN795_c0_g1_i1.p1 TRINITY_DN795_c0_g1~~TRINITY_DN795_c0_g1_i1.p1  ORF type:complete len:332 (-),score=94.80 TRINITY_DN795_c0_g1_i1:258-1253(-)